MEGRPNDLQQRLGFQDLQAAHDWLAENPRGRLVRINADDPTSAEACCSPACLLERQSLKVQLAGVEQKPGGLPIRNPITHNCPSLHPADITPDTLKTTTISDPPSSSWDPLALSNPQLKAICASLAESLCNEREQNRKERDAWLTFKRDYATLVACRIIDEQDNKNVPVPVAIKDSLSPKGPKFESGFPLARKETSDEIREKDAKINSQPSEGSNRKRPSSESRLEVKSPVRARPMMKGVKSPSPRKTHVPKASPLKDQISHRVTPRLPAHLKRNTVSTPQSARGSRTPSSARSALPTPRWIRYSDRKARHSMHVWNDDPAPQRLVTSKNNPRSLKTPTLYKPHSEDVFFLQASKPHPNCASSVVQASKLTKKTCSTSQHGDPSEKQQEEEEEEEEDRRSRRRTRRGEMDDVPAVGSVVNEKDDELSTTEGSEDHRFAGLMEGMMDSGGDRLGTSSKGKQRAMSSSVSPLRKREGEEEFPGQRYMRQVHKKRQEGVIGKSSARGSVGGDDIAIKGATGGDGSVEDIEVSKIEIDPRNNFGVNHVFNEVARGKQIRKQMHARGCECCAGYYEQAAKDLNGSTGDGSLISRHQHEISRHRHFHPPPLTPPDYWQLGFPDTPRVAEINRKAEENKMMMQQEKLMQAKNGNGAYKLRK